MKQAICYDDVISAAQVLEGVATRTPLLISRTVNDRTGQKVFFKDENFQRTGSFKFRGAYNTLARMDAVERKRGVIAISSGNHGQGLALAGKLLGTPVLIATPDDVPESKIAAIQGYGADVKVFSRETDERQKFVTHMVDTHGRAFVHPYDHPNVMAGQGTVALEMLRDVPDLDVLVAPVGGGGLLSGCVTAAKSLNPRIRIFGVETEKANDWFLSFQRHERVRIPQPETIADGMRIREPGELTFPIVMKGVEDILLVSDEEVLETMRFLLFRMKILVEPTGAVAPAAVLQGKVGVPDSKVGVVVSGGNVDSALLSQLTVPASRGRQRAQSKTGTT
jgi:threonine dehydratase